MALKATIFKAELQIADMDRNYYGDHSLTLARHPSETDERMMVRLLAFALHASDTLTFTKGLSSDDEPDIWQKDLTDAIELWIEVGAPDEQRLRKACNRARQVLVYHYGGRGSEIWWNQNQSKLARFDNLAVYHIPDDSSEQLAQLAQRTMRLQCTVQEGPVGLGDGERSVEVEPVVWKKMAGR
ncbi:MAG TPA: YaeQ family protein [Gammaproteobacteria bacterium]